MMVRWICWCIPRRGRVGFCGTVQGTGKTASEMLHAALLTKFKTDEFQRESAQKRTLGWTQHRKPTAWKGWEATPNLFLDSQQYYGWGCSFTVFYLQQLAVSRAVPLTPIPHSDHLPCIGGVQSWAAAARLDLTKGTAGLRSWGESKHLLFQQKQSVKLS